MNRRQATAAVLTAALVVLALMALFAVELTNNQAHSRSDIEGRVHERSVLAAALIDSLFATSARTSVITDQRLYGGRTVPMHRLDQAAGAGDRYVVLLDPSGLIIAHSKGFNAQARADLGRSEALRLLRAGHPWALGNVLPFAGGGVINYGIAFPTRYGERYLLTGFPPQTLAPFLLGELREIPGVPGHHNYVLDGPGVVIASTNPARFTGYRFHTPVQLSVLHHASGVASDHYFDQVPLPNTSWRILLTAPEGPLFASVTGLRKWLPWIIFAAFGVVALLALVLTRRALRDGDRVRVAHERLELAHEGLAAAHLELERRAAELARSNAELDQFASIASHDLQEPLRKIRTYAERVRVAEGTAMSERGHEYLERAEASAARMQQLIQDLLRFARVSTQGRPFVPVDLAQISEEVLEDLDGLIREAGAEITVGPLPEISGDPVQLRQLLQNLISNAIKFRRAEVTPTVHISAEPAGPELLRLTVRDNGIGFESRYAVRIFRVFERLHGRGAYPGTGIGLAVCRRIAERHGGEIVADGVPDEGATFTVTLQTRLSGAANATEAQRQEPDEQSADPKEPYVPA